MKNKFQKSNQFFKRVKEVIPLASQTFSKSYLQYVKGRAPLFITRGKGSSVWDIDGNKYVDFVMGLLAVILGYQYPSVDRAIQQQLKKGINFSLSSLLEYELAKILIKHIPGAQMLRFGKNGSDVTAGAVRLARAITGREHLLVAGYHGWQDWYIGATSRNLGVPKSTQGLTHKFIYNDIDSLEALFKKYKNKVAGVVMEPMNYEEPKDNFLQKVKELTHKNKALLVFDEVITGFRWSLGGAQEYFGVVPDLACFGKSMANGMPVSALVGKREYMEKIENIFFSFTFGGEALSLAAAIATIKEMEKKKVIDYIWQKGKELKDKTMEIIRANCLEDVIQLKGKPCWTVFSISPAKGYSEMEIKSYLQQEILAQGFLWYGQHNLSFSHSQQDIEDLLKTYGKVFAQLKKLLLRHKLRENLRGKPISQIFKIR